MQADGDSLSDEGAKCGLWPLVHGSTINLNFKYRARRANTIRIWVLKTNISYGGKS
jgi:hypothetical protein